MCAKQRKTVLKRRERQCDSGDKDRKQERWLLGTDKMRRNGKQKDGDTQETDNFEVPCRRMSTYPALLVVGKPEKF